MHNTRPATTSGGLNRSAATTSGDLVNCPYCEHGETKVVDSRVAGKGAIRRRRECLLCAQRFTTFERTEESPLFVGKRDGSRQRSDLAKLMAGLLRACTSGALSLDHIEGAAGTVEARLR